MIDPAIIKARAALSNNGDTPTPPDDIGDPVAYMSANDPPTDRTKREIIRTKLIAAVKKQRPDIGRPTQIVDPWLESKAGERTQGQSFVLQDTEPAEDEVEGVELLDEVRDVYARYVHAADEACVALTLWTVYSFVFDAFGVSPILKLTSPVFRCGKSSTLVILSCLTNRALLAGNITSASLFRGVEAWHPTLIVDEADRFVAANDEMAGLLNAGWTRGTAFVVRVEGDRNEPRLFSAWCPKAIAAIGTLSETIEDRSIRVSLDRKPVGVRKADAFDVDVVHAVTEPVRRRIARWTADNLAAIATAQPTRPPGLDDRSWNNWKPLLAVAEVAGGDWPARARSAAVALSGGEDAEDVSTLLLRHIREAFGGADRISTADLMRALVDNDEGPWAKWWARDVAADELKSPAARLARMLRPFKDGEGARIKSKKIRFGAATVQGFERVAFEDAWARYLPADPTPGEGHARTNHPGKEGTEGTKGTLHVSPTSDVPSVPFVPTSGGPSERARARADGSDPFEQLDAFLDASPDDPYFDASPGDKEAEDDG